VRTRPAARGPGAGARPRDAAAKHATPAGPGRGPSSPPPRFVADPWAWATLLAVLPLAQRMRGAPWGEPVAEDFDFLHRALLEGMGTLLDGGGSHAFWRPVPFQLYYAAFGRLILSAPAAVTVIHLGLLALGALLLYRALRTEWSGPLACVAATFTLFAEGTRTIAGWSAQFVDVAVFVASALAVHEASRRRWWSSLAALLVALLSKEVAVVTGLLLPLVPGVAPAGTREQRVRVRVRFALGVAGVLAAWGLASWAVRHAAGLEMPRHILDSEAARQASVFTKLGWAFASSLRAVSSLPRIPSPDDGLVFAMRLAVVGTAVAVFALHRPARARLRRAAPWIGWGMGWFALATLTLAPLYPAWQSNRAQFGGIGLGIGATAILGAAHPALAGAFAAGRLVMLERAPGAATAVQDSLPDTGAFMDWTHLTRLERFMRATRRALAARYPTLPHGAIVVQENLPHQVEYALGGDRALQVWYHDPTLRWMRFDAWRAAPETPATVIVQGESHREPEVALLEPEAVRLLFLAHPLVEAHRLSEALVLLDRADALVSDTNAVKYRITSGSWRAYAWVETGRVREGTDLAAHILALEPRHQLARDVYALGLAKQDRLVEAVQQLEILRQLAPDDPAARSLQAQIEARLGTAIKPAVTPPVSPPAR